MKIVHETNGQPRTLARNVEVANSILRQGLGLMFRRSIPDDYALVFPFDEEKPRRLHMLFVPFDIDAIWITDGRVQKMERLPSWTGHARGRGDTIIELPAGAGDGVQPGDLIEVE